jgi:pilus assembly protein FimV
LKNRPYLVARTALAMAALAAMSAAPLDVLAVGLGRLNVQSALGEGMRAEIDITSLSAEEAASLNVRIASPEAYRAAGVDYNAVLAGTQAIVARRADGRHYLRVVSDRAVQEPFIEVILEMNSTSGRMVREFTLLFDPPGNRMAPPVQAAAPVAPVISAAPAPAPAPAAPVVAAAPRVAPAPAPRPASAASAMPAPAAAVAAAPAAPRPRPAPAPRPAATPPAAPAAPASDGARRYAVKPGDTLYRVAGRTQPAGVSLDQMLVGLYRANPDAFIEANVNKLRAGSVLQVPAADEVRDLTAADARRLITAQSADFSAYRARLAQGVPLAQAPEAGRQAKGRVEAAVDDRKQSAAPSPDKLKLSGAGLSASAPHASSGADGQRKDDAARVAELRRNVEELKRLQQGTAAVQAPVATAPAVPPAAAPATPPAPAPAPVAAASVAPVPAIAAQTGGGAASSPLAIARPPIAAPVPVEAETGLLEGLTDNPWLLPVGGGLAVLLGGLAIWWLRSRGGKAASETSFLESRMQPDSFFGASGGQRVDTREAGNSSNSASSVGYSMSQLDAIGDVDPVAEADVYLAYGRDLQAEEILKEAMRATPERLAVRTKLLEVYAKRRDTKGFELLATQLYALTKGVGADWAKAQALGLQIEPDNQLYQPGGHPEEIILDGERVVVEPLGATTQPHSVLSTPTQPPEDSRLPQLGGDSSLDLDLDEPSDFGGLGNEATQPMVSSAQRTVEPGLRLDFDDTSPRRRPPAVPSRAVSTDVDFDSLAMDFDGGQPPAAPPADTVVDHGDNLIDFTDNDTTQPGTISGMERTTPSPLDDLPGGQGDPLARKLELADEFRQIGDMEGARDLLEEVLAKATGTLRAKAQTMLNQLG